MAAQNNDVSRSWFAVFNNPENHGYAGAPQEIIDKLRDEWKKAGNTNRGYWAYCISEHGTPHVHMVLESSCAMRFSKVKNAYPQAHLEPTKGNKNQVMAYIKKEPPYDEKGEKVICTTSSGEISGNSVYDLSSRSSTLQIIEQLLENGMTPSQVMAEDIRFRPYESIIKKVFFDKRSHDTPVLRSINTIWHLGESGSGKTYTFQNLCEQYGEDKIYLFTDYSNNGTSGFDNYQAEEILFLDELKAGALPFHLLLTMLQGYKSQMRCRYTNCYALWNEVHITSIYPPEEIYESLVTIKRRETDTIQQLLRRINKYVYHYVENGEFKTFELPADKYKNYKSLLSMVPVQSKSGFKPVGKDTSIPFEQDNLCTEKKAGMP